VSLTINKVEGNVLSFYLIPETLKRTNLKNLKTMNLKEQNYLNVEFDYMAKAIVNVVEART
jgi:riboflavin synthase alpha subunit